MRIEFIAALVMVAFATSAAMMAGDALAARPIAIDDLFRFARISDPQVSPDGELVCYVVGQVDLKENKSSSSLWLVPTAGGPARQLTNAGKKDRHPRWSPDGTKVLFESDRSGENQLWVISIHGGEARKLTSISSEAGTAIWSPDGKKIAFVSAVFPDLSSKPFVEADAEFKKRKEAKEKSPIKARVFDRLFYRHWDSWVEGKRQHLFVIPADGGEPRNITPGDRDAYPTSTTFSVGDDFCFSPDSGEIYYTAVPATNEAWSTNFDIFRVSVEGGKPTCVTEPNLAADSAPAFSPDGSKLAWRVQRRAGFEADKWELMIAGPEGKNPRSLTAKLDRSVEHYAWADDKTIVFLAEVNGGTPIFALDIDSGDAKIIHEGGTTQAISASKSGNQLAFLQSTLARPADVYAIDIKPSAGSAKARRLTTENDAILAELDLPKPTSVTVPGADGTPMQMWILKPPGFDPAMKWPLIYLVHGGPQGAWQDAWSFRWNPELWAAQGYVIAMPNPRGSTGFGQKYVDEISGDWGGRCFVDLMKGVDYLEKEPYLDKDRFAAAGASFGGYMMNFFQGKTDRFKTLVTHCGVFNFDTMYSTTDELWFDEWEHGGPPWVARKSYDEHSPHKFAANFKTPMLIIHNDQDFRVPVGEGFQIFTTLQRLGVPSKMINFPDEGHWVLKPANSKFWHEEIFDWLRRYVAPGGR